MLRIVAGALGGRRIRTPPAGTTRPTPERVREAWFSALGGRVAEGRVLDLYAGSGALGLEALSRGAPEVHFVERDARAVRVLRSNVAELGVEARVRVVRRDVERFLAELEGEGGAPPYRLALADPPYGSGAARRLWERQLGLPFAALLCVEHPPGALPDRPSVTWRRRYGDTEVSFVPAPTTGPEASEPSDEETP